MLWILDNGHGVNTPGKRSPKWENGVYYEGRGNRAIVRHIVELASAAGLEVLNLVPEDDDVKLSERIKRIKKAAGKRDDVVVVSVHSDAFSNPNAKGWSAWTTPGETKSDAIATHFYLAAAKHFPHRAMRRDQADGDPDFEARFYMLTKHRWPAVLTENFFMTNRDDYRLLTSAAGPRRIAAMHVEAMLAVEREEINKKAEASDNQNET